MVVFCVINLKLSNEWSEVKRTMFAWDVVKSKCEVAEKYVSTSTSQFCFNTVKPLKWISVLCPVWTLCASEASHWSPESEFSARVHLSVIRRAMPTMWQHLPSDLHWDKRTDLWRRVGVRWLAFSLCGSNRPWGRF